MTKKTCQAGKDVCQVIEFGDGSYECAHGKSRMARLHHADAYATPCGEGCKAQEKPEPVGESYHDFEGNPCTLYHLVRTEPAWTENLIRSLQVEVEDYRQTLTFHTCCPMDAKRLDQMRQVEERAEKAEAERDELQEHMGVLVEALYKIKTEKGYELEGTGYWGRRMQSIAKEALAAYQEAIKE